MKVFVPIYFYADRRDSSEELCGPDGIEKCFLTHKKALDYLIEKVINRTEWYMESCDFFDDDMTDDDSTSISDSENNATIKCEIDELQQRLQTLDEFRDYLINEGEFACEYGKFWMIDILELSLDE